VRRMVLPSVYPKPGSSGSTMKRDRFSATCSSSIWGRWTISTVSSSLRVELDDQLFLDGGVDLVAAGEIANRHPAIPQVDIEPFRRDPIKGVDRVLNDHQIVGSLLDGDHVVLAHLVGGDVDLL